MSLEREDSTVVGEDLLLVKMGQPRWRIAAIDLQQIFGDYMKVRFFSVVTQLYMKVKHQALLKFSGSRA